MNDPAQSRTALVTGAASGIGRATALRLASDAVEVVIADRNVAGANEVAAAIRAAGGRARVAEIDLSDLSAVERLFDVALADGEALDILVCAAGFANRSPLADTSLQNWQSLMDVNLTSVFLCCRGAVARMTRGSGRIVNVASHSALLGSVERGAYAATKGGMAAMTRVLAVEIASAGITANTVAPGPIDTAMTSRNDDAQRRKWLDALPIKRYGTADEVAAAIVFLCSRDAAYITGQLLSVDGGFSAAGLLT
jgi:NAD(P)-dependent dehydrogenase (short-subunit alcohol dehydrogenase family)